MLLPDHRGEQAAGNGAGFLFCGDGGDASGGVDGGGVVAFGVGGAGDIRLSKRNIRGPYEWCVLLSLNP